MDEVETGIQETRHTPARRLDDDAAGRRRLDIAGPDRRRRIDDDRWQRVAARSSPRPAVRRRSCCACRRRCPPRPRAERFRPPACHRRASEGGNTAGIDDALDACGFGFLHHDARTVHIGGKDLARVARPQPVVRRHVKHVADAGHRPAHRFGVTDVTADEFQIESVQMGAGTAGPDQSAYAESFGDQAVSPQPSQPILWPR